MQWTQDQLEAINARGENLLLAAAAGSGKTTVLVERILSLLEEGANIDEMLVVTFTNAAAGDMLEKLTEKLIERAREKPLLSDQIERLDRAGISTIHSFCIRVLRDFFEAADVDPVFRVMDAPEGKQLERQALKEAMESRYAREDDDLESLIFGRNAEKVADLALELYGFALNRPDPKAYLEASLSRLEGDGAQWARELARAVRRKLRDALSLFHAPLELYERTGAPDFYLDLARADVQAVGALMTLDYEALRLALGSFSLDRWKSPKSGALPPDQEDAVARHKELRELGRKAMTEIRSGKSLKLIPLEDAIEDIRLSAPALRALIEIVEDMDARLYEMKNERSAYGFADLEHRALRALADESVAEALKARFTHVFVDEYQDVSDVQEAIVSRLCRGDNLTMVGDVKQSIYRFRQAEPKLFLSKYAAFGKNENGRLIALRQNFRSRAAILHFANGVFERVMTGGDAEIEYDEIAYLCPGARYENDDPPIEMHLIYSDSGEAEEEPAKEEAAPGDDLTAAEQEGALIAARVREMLGAPYYDAKERRERPLKYGDFVILARTRGVMPHLERMLKDAGIPAYADMAESYFDALEVRTMLALLKLIENRRSDIELLAVLRSPVVSLTSEELAEVRGAAREISYRDAMLKYMDERDDPLSERLRAFEGRLIRWRMLSISLPLAQFVELLLRETRYYAYVGALPGGRARQANLTMLSRLAGDYEKTSAGALSGFLQYLQDAPRGGDDFGTAHVLGEGDDVVQIMTVHMSKGLEFPVVFAAQMGRSIAGSNRNTGLFMHRELGVGMVLNDRWLGSARDTLACRAIRERKALEDLNEEMRVLYVLITRAKHALIMTGQVKNRPKRMREWQIGARNPLRPKTWLDAVMPALLARADDADAEIADQFTVSDPTGGFTASVRWTSAATLARETTAAYEDEARALVALIDECLIAPPDGAAEAGALSWTYPHKSEILLPLKLTTTGLAREITGPEALPALAARPRFLSEEGISAAERGTLTHTALQSLELDPIKNLTGEALLGEIERQTRAMRARGILFAPVDARLLARFFEGETGRRLIASERVEREWAFNLRLSAREAMLADSDAPVLVQGVVDCCFLEEDKWILLDYKTDRADDEGALVARYGPQVALYAMAVERITGTPVAEKRIVLLRAGREILLDDREAL